MALKIYHIFLVCFWLLRAHVYSYLRVKCVHLQFLRAVVGFVGSILCIPPCSMQRTHETAVRFHAKMPECLMSAMPMYMADGDGGG